MRRLLMTSAFAALTAPILHAEDAAILLGTDSYETLGRLSDGGVVTAAQEGLAALGFDVTTLRNGRAEATAEALEKFAVAIDEAGRRVIALSGRFVTDGDRTWYLTAEAADPTYLTLGSTAISVDSLLRVIAREQGQALVLIGADESDEVFDDWLRAGIGAIKAPQGVTVLRGTPAAVGAFAKEALIQPQVDLLPLAARYELATSGFVPPSLVLMPARPSIVPAPATPAPDTTADTALWEGAVALDTADAYRNYIRKFPNGLHTAEAEDLISQIIAEPNRPARLAEEALNLSRDERREIQRHLSILEYNTRGVDGIFGTGTRQAITNWQQENGYTQNSYLTREQITRLDAQATRKAAELNAEAERRQREQALLDRSFWEETGAKGDEPGLRAYLEKYPDGTFSEVARERLDLIEEDKRNEAEAEENAAWDKAKDGDVVAAYQDYLSVYPEGRFVTEAQARIAELTAERETAADTEAAREAERALGLTTQTRRLIEARLDAMGLEPGPVDGEFSAESRRAIRRYQRTNDMEATGFLSEATIVRLLADAVESLGK